jgi:hypothetical protein
VLEAKANLDTVKPAASWQALATSLPGTSGFQGDPVALQRELRTEWDRP